MSKGDNLNFLKTQTYVLKVNIHCEGCKHKVKKLLQKIDGVYTISIDSEQGNVTVTGTVDPATLIKKLSKAGKHSELLAPKGGGNNNNNKNNDFLQEQLQKLQLEAGKSQQKDNGAHQKGAGGGGGGDGGKEQKGQQLPQQMKGFQNLKLPQLKDFKLPSQKDQKKNVKFNVPIEDLDDEGSEFDDDDDSYGSEDYDDDDDDLDVIDDFEDDPKHSNLTPMKDQKQGTGGNENDKKGGEKYKKANSKKGGDEGESISLLRKLIGSINGGKKGSSDGGKNGGDNNKKGVPNGNGKGSGGNLDNVKNSNGGKKANGGGGGGGQTMNLNPKMMMGQGGNQGMDMGRMKASMGHAMSLKSPAGMPPGYYQGAMVGPEMMSVPTNPYLQQQQQQQYMAAMQQRMMMMNGGAPNGPPQMAYGQPMGYGPPPPTYGEPAYAHYFSDENANSCSIM